MPMARRSSRRHGTLPPEFAAWIAIRSRDPANEVWCSFVDFYLDVGPRPSWRHLVVRDDPAGGFEPGNAPRVVNNCAFTQDADFLVGDLVSLCRRPEQARIQAGSSRAQSADSSA